MAILSLLISLLLPALRRSMTVARAAVCLSNLKQLTIAARAYSSDFRGFAAPVFSQYNYPLGAPWNAMGCYTNDLYPSHIQATFGRTRGNASSFDHWLALGYLNAGKNYRDYRGLPGNDVFTCRAMAGSLNELSWDTNWAGISETHYSILSILVRPRFDAGLYPPRSKNYFGAYTMDEFTKPSKALMLADTRWSQAADGSIGVSGTFMHLTYPNINYRDHVEAYVGRVMSFPGAGIVWNHRFWVHGEGANAAYVDGHAGSLSGQWQMTQPAAMKAASTVDHLGW